MEKYFIELNCWDGSNLFVMELDNSQKELLETISLKSNENSQGGYQPTMQIGKVLEEKICPKCGEKMDQNIEEYGCPECFYGEDK